MQFSDPNTHLHENLIQLVLRDHLSKKNSDQLYDSVSSPDSILNEMQVHQLHDPYELTSPLHEMHFHLQSKFTQRDTYQIPENYFQEFPFHLISVEWFAFQKFHNCRIFWKLSKDSLLPCRKFRFFGLYENQKHPLFPGLYDSYLVHTT